MTTAELDAIVVAKREMHPELRGALTWQGLRNICDREHIPILFRELPVDALMITGLGAGVMIINARLDPRRHTYRGAHELAHHWAHTSREPVIYTMRDLAGADEREDEAEYIATRLLQGW